MCWTYDSVLGHSLRLKISGGGSWNALKVLLRSKCCRLECTRILLVSVAILAHRNMLLHEIDGVSKLPLKLGQLILLDCVHDAWVSRKWHTEFLGRGVTFEEGSRDLVISVHAQHLINHFRLIFYVAVLNVGHNLLELVLAIDYSLFKQLEGLAD